MSKADSAIKKFKKLIKKSKIKKLKDFVKESEKTDGVSEGGIYSLTTTNTDGSTKTTRYMLKKMDPYSMAAEYVGSHIARLYVGKSAPTVDLVRGDDGSVYVASEFIPNFQTLKDFSAKLGIPKECFPYGCVADQNGNYVPIAPHLQGILDSHHVTTNKSVSDAEKINIVAEFLQHDDTHDRNIGIIVDQNAQSIDLKATAIDWSWSLRGNNPDSPIVYYSDNYDPEKIVKAIDQVVEITPTQIKSLTEPLFDNLRECYGPQTTFNPGISPRNYLRHLASLVLPSWTPNLNIDDLQSNMISTLEKRSKKLIEEKTKIESAAAHDQAHEISVTPSTLTTIGSTATSLANMADHSNTHAIYSSNVSNSLFNQTTPPPQNFTELLNSHQNYTLPSQSPNPYHHTRVLTNGTIAPHNQTNTSQTPVVGAVALAAVALGTIIRRSMRSTAPTTKGTGSAPKKEKPHTLG